MLNKYIQQGESRILVFFLNKKQWKMSSYIFPSGKRNRKHILGHIVLYLTCGGIILFTLLFHIQCSNTIPFESVHKGNETGRQGGRPSFLYREHMRVLNWLTLPRTPWVPSHSTKTISLLLRGEEVHTQEGVVKMLKLYSLIFMVSECLDLLNSQPC